MKRKFIIDYNGCDIELMVDDEPKYLKIYKVFLVFFVWEFDNTGDVLIEAVKKFSVEILRQSVKYWTTEGMIKEFNEKEGYPRLCGADGITLVMFTCNNIIMENFLEVREYFEDKDFVNHSEVITT